MLTEAQAGPVYGNPEAVGVLEKWLAKAKQGMLCHVTVTACENPNKIFCDFGGCADMQFAIRYGLDTLKLKMDEQIRLASGPKPTGELDASYVCYNCGDMPLSYDFLLWLLDAEMTRIREGAPAPLKVAFVFGQDGKAGLGTPYRLTMFVNVVRPLLKLIGAVENSEAWAGRQSDWYTVLGITKAARAGEQVPHFTPSVEAQAQVASFLGDAPPPVTITLRETSTYEKRNSNLAAWLKFADDLERLGERVIFVRDTDKAGEPLLGRETCPTASVNLDVRTALYAVAKANLFVPNGPWNIALFGTKPWLMFNQLDPNDKFYPNTPAFWSESQGINEGEQFPWSQPNQRIVWMADDYENIVKAWDELNLRA